MTTSGPARSLALVAVLIAAAAASAAEATPAPAGDGDGAEAEQVLYDTVQTAEELQAMQSDSSRPHMAVLFVRSTESSAGKQALRAFDAATRTARLDASMEAVRYVVVEMGASSDAADPTAWSSYFSQLRSDVALPELAVRSRGAACPALN